MTVQPLDANFDTTASFEELIEYGTTGELLQAAAILQNRITTKLRNPDAFNELAEYSMESDDDHSNEWGLPLAAIDPDRIITPTAPENFVDTLPHMNKMAAELDRTRLQIRAVLTKFTERAFEYNKDTLLGIPENAVSWHEASKYISDIFEESIPAVKPHMNRAAFLVEEPGAPDFVPSEPELPVVSQDFFDNKIGEENINTVSRLCASLKLFAQETGVSQQDVEDVLRVYEPTISQAAQEMRPSTFAKHASNLLEKLADLLNPDGPSPKEVLNKKEINGAWLRKYDDYTELLIRSNQIDMQLFAAMALPARSPHVKKLRKDKTTVFDKEPSSKAAPEQDIPGQTSIDVELDDSARASNCKNASATETQSSEKSQGSDLFDDQSYLGNSAGQRVDVFDHSAEGLSSDGLDPAEPLSMTADGSVDSAADVDNWDDRTPAGKLHDALLAAMLTIARISKSDSPLPQLHGVPARINLQIDFQSFMNMISDHGIPEHLKRPPGYIPEPHPFIKTSDGAPVLTNPDGSPATSPADVAGLLKKFMSRNSDHQDYDDQLVTHRDLKSVDANDVATELAFQHPARIIEGLLAGTVSFEEARIWACDAEILPMILNGKSQPLDIADTRRHFSAKQFMILAATQRGCQAPGCTQPAERTHVHHVVYHSEGGNNSLANAILLCPACHRAVHGGKWTIVTQPDGTHWFQAAPWFIPDGKLRRNIFWDTYRNAQPAHDLAA